MKPKTFLSNDQIKSIKNEISEIECMLSDKESSQDGVGYMAHAKNHISNEGEVKHMLNKKKKMLQDLTPQKLKGPAANKAWDWAKKAETWIKENIPDTRSHGMMYPRGGGTAREDVNFDEAVRKEMNWMQRSSKIIETYRHIMRRLDPQNPMLTNIERFRR